MKKFLQLTLISFILYAFSYAYTRPSVELLNVSYSPTREFYSSYNKLFIKNWQRKHQQSIKIYQSHGASGAQARAVIAGLGADVVTLGLAYDIDAIAERGNLIYPDWQKKFPHNSCPYTSTIVFLVRKGNPKKIRDWDDLIRPDIKIITPNPKTSGGARWNYLAAWGYALKKYQMDEEKAKEFITKLYKNVPILDSGARTATSTFVQRDLGDVLLAWENDALLVTKVLEKNKYEIVLPSISVLAETPIAVVTKNTDKTGTTAIAIEYLQYLYSDEAQELIAKNFFRPVNSRIASQFKNQFPEIKLMTIKDFGNWKAIQTKHFSDGGIFDQIYKNSNGLKHEKK